MSEGGIFGGRNNLSIYYFNQPGNKKMVKTAFYPTTFDIFLTSS